MFVVRPTGSRVYVKITQESKTSSGLVIVRKKQEWQEETLAVEIIAVGQDTSSEIKPGAIGIISGSAGRWIDPYLTPDQDAIYRVIEQDEIIAILEEAQNG